MPCPRGEPSAEQDAEAKVQFPVPAGNQLPMVLPVTVTISKLGRLLVHGNHDNARWTNGTLDFCF
jgi:hypothetical protein